MRHCITKHKRNPNALTVLNIITYYYSVISLCLCVCFVCSANGSTAERCTAMNKNHFQCVLGDTDNELQVVCTDTPSFRLLRLLLMQSIQWNIKYYYLNNEMNTNTHAECTPTKTMETKTRRNNKTDGAREWCTRIALTHWQTRKESYIFVYFKHKFHSLININLLLWRKILVCITIIPCNCLKLVIVSEREEKINKRITEEPKWHWHWQWQKHQWPMPTNKYSSRNDGERRQQ